MIPLKDPHCLCHRAAKYSQIHQCGSSERLPHMQDAQAFDKSVIRRGQTSAAAKPLASTSARTVGGSASGAPGQHSRCITAFLAPNPPMTGGLSAVRLVSTARSLKLRHLQVHHADQVLYAPRSVYQQ